MQQLPYPVSSVLVRQSERSLWDTAIRIKNGIDPVAVLGSLCRKLSAISHELGSPIYLCVEPNGDACDTGHWVEVEVEAGIVWAEMTPWPQRFGGAVPTNVDAELKHDGWVATAETWQEDVSDLCMPSAAEFAALEQTAPTSEVVRRLVADVVDTDLHQWSGLVDCGVRRVIDPHAQGWYLHASVAVDDAGPLHDSPYAATEFDGAWSIDLGQLLHPPN